MKSEICNWALELTDDETLRLHPDGHKKENGDDCPAEVYGDAWIDLDLAELSFEPGDASVGYTGGWLVDIRGYEGLTCACGEPIPSASYLEDWAAHEAQEREIGRAEAARDAYGGRRVRQVLRPINHVALSSIVLCAHPDELDMIRAFVYNSNHVDPNAIGSKRGLPALR